MYDWVDDCEGAVTRARWLCCDGKDANDVCVCEVGAVAEAVLEAVDPAAYSCCGLVLFEGRVCRSTEGTLDRYEVV